MNNGNLWGEIQPIELVTPDEILQRQSNVFNKRFDVIGLTCYLEVSLNENEMADQPWNELEVINAVSEDDSDNKAVIKLMINAKKLNNYTIVLLKASYLMAEIYPVTIEDYFNEKTYNCKDQKEFTDSLEAILQSPKVLNVISKLLTLVKYHEKS